MIEDQPQTVLSRQGPHIPARLSFVLTLLLASTFLWLAFRGADWNAMLMMARLARLDYLILGAITLTVSLWLRGIRCMPRHPAAPGRSNPVDR